VPTYDYVCRSCGHLIEVVHRMTEDGPETCERCGGELRRMLYPAGIIFKGSGFYKTDSRSGASSSTTSSPSTGTAGTSGADGGSGGSSSDSGPPKAPAPKESSS